MTAVAAVSAAAVYDVAADLAAAAAAAAAAASERLPNAQSLKGFLVLGVHWYLGWVKPRRLRGLALPSVQACSVLSALWENPDTQTCKAAGPLSQVLRGAPLSLDTGDTPELGSLVYDAQAKWGLAASVLVGVTLAMASVGTAVPIPRPPGTVLLHPCLQTPREPLAEESPLGETP